MDPTEFLGINRHSRRQLDCIYTLVAVTAILCKTGGWVNSHKLSLGAFYSLIEPKFLFFPVFEVPRAMITSTVVELRPTSKLGTIGILDASDRRYVCTYM